MSLRLNMRGNKKMKKLMHKASISTLNIFVCIILGLILITGVFTIPTSRIESNVSASCEVLKEEGTYHNWYTWCHSQQDNWTDSIILLESSYNSNDSSLHKAMMVYRNSVETDTPCNDLVAHYIDGVPYISQPSYARYWHGYLVILKPLLCLLTYQSIRILNGILQGLLFLATCILMYKRGLKLHIIPYAITYLILMPVVLSKCLQYSPCYYAFTLGMISLLLIPSKRLSQSSYLVFLNIGIFVAYFDFLTYPLITVGIPAILLMALIRNQSLITKILTLLESGIYWAMGYVLMWASKWGLATIITGTNIFSDAMNQISKRTSSEMPEYLGEVSSFRCILMNFKTFFKTPFSIFFVIMVLVLSVFLATHIKKNDLMNISVNLLPYVILSILPIAWFLVTRNHSSVHFWFTNKICAITAMSIMVGLIECTITNASHNIRAKAT